MSGPARRCAAPGCANPVEHPAGRRGRPPIYCCPQCRPSHAGLGRPPLVIEVVPPDAEGRRTGRDWCVRLRRGPAATTVRTELGYLSAQALATELAALLAGGTRVVVHQPKPLPNGGAIG